MIASKFSLTAPRAECLPVPDMNQIRNDEWDILKHLPRPLGSLAPMLARRPPTEEAIDKFRSLTALVHWWIPGRHEELKDPIRYLQKAISDLAVGRGRLGVSLLDMADPTDPSDPLRQTLLALVYARDGLIDIYHPDVADSPFVGWPVEWLNRLPASEQSVPMHCGYRVDNFMVGSARDVLDEILVELHHTDLRRPIMAACIELIDRCVSGLAGWEEAQVEGEELVYRWNKDDPSALELWETWAEDMDEGRW